MPSEATQLGVRLSLTAPAAATGEDWLDVAAARLHAGFTPVPIAPRPAPVERLLALPYFRTAGFAEGAAPGPGTSTAQAFVFAVSSSAARMFVDLP